MYKFHGPECSSSGWSRPGSWPALPGSSPSSGRIASSMRRFASPRRSGAVPGRGDRRADGGDRPPGRVTESLLLSCRIVALRRQLLAGWHTATGHLSPVGGRRLPGAAASPGPAGLLGLPRARAPTGWNKRQGTTPVTLTSRKPSRSCYNKLPPMRAGGARPPAGEAAAGRDVSRPATTPARRHRSASCRHGRFHPASPSSSDAFPGTPFITCQVTAHASGASRAARK